MAPRSSSSGPTRPIFALGYVVSGHTLKHLAAAAAVACILALLRSRRADRPPDLECARSSG